jgi:hypothetical protein
MVPFVSAELFVNARPVEEAVCVHPSNVSGAHRHSASQPWRREAIVRPVEFPFTTGIPAILTISRYAVLKRTPHYQFVERATNN